MAREIKRKSVIIRSVILISMMMMMILLIFVPLISLNNDLAKLEGIVDSYIHSNTYIQAQISEEKFISFLYNKNKEAFSQTNTGGIAVYRKDDKMVAFDDELKVEYGISPLRMIELALEMVRKHKAKLIKPSPNSEQGHNTIKTYIIEMAGKEKVREYYSLVDSRYADIMVQELYGIVQSDKGTMHITIYVGENNEFGASCDVIVGETQYRSWYFDGHMQMFDWVLTERWYSNDNTKDDWVMIVNTLVSEIENKTKQFAEENNIDLGKE